MIQHFANCNFCQHSLSVLFTQVLDGLQGTNLGTDVRSNMCKLLRLFRPFLYLVVVSMVKKSGEAVDNNIGKHVQLQHTLLWSFGPVRSVSSSLSFPINVHPYSIFLNLFLLWLRWISSALICCLFRCANSFAQEGVLCSLLLIIPNIVNHFAL